MEGMTNMMRGMARRYVSIYIFFDSAYVMSMTKSGEFGAASA